MPYLRTFSNVLRYENALCSKAKKFRIVLRHSIRPDFLERRWLYFSSKKDPFLVYSILNTSSVNYTSSNGSSQKSSPKQFFARIVPLSNEFSPTQMHFEIDIHFLFGVWHCCKGTNSSSKPERKLCQKRHNNHSHSSWIISTKHIISDNLSGKTYILLNKILPFLVHCATRQRDQRDLIPVKTQWYTSFFSD